MNHYSHLRPLRLHSVLKQFSRDEAKELALAWGALSLAFAFLQSGLSSLGSQFVFTLVVSAMTVGIGFLLHEVMHKVAALHYGTYARFHADKKMLILAVILPLFLPFLFAAPGAVVIYGHLTRKQNGMVSAAGPATNILLALLFYLLTLIGDPLISLIGTAGFSINAFLALFNMIPLGNLDGAKVLAYSKPLFTVLITIPILMLIL